ncbi:MAG: hypothetical protein JWO05_3375, partial [Gemmatimonadetes bacterium]|nr:hypothetical protein [Gemmatimonadota bacterium]
VINATQERFTGPNIVPTVTGTLFFQSRIAANVFLDGQLQALTWLQPSTSRQEPLNQLPVTAPATTMTVNITSPVAVSRFVVIADTGAGQPIVLLQNGTGMTSGSVVVPAYASTKWRVRVAATDSTGVNGATLLSFMPASGIASSITVAATGNVVVPVTLSQFSSTWAMAATGTVAGQVAMSGGVTDPGFITTSCFARWTMAAFTTPTSGTLVACSFGVPSGATRAVSGFVSPNATGTLSTKLILNGSYILTDGRTIELDIVPAIATSTIGAALAVDLVGNGFANWWNANMDPNLLGMSVTADEVTSSFGNFGMRWNGQQPRIAFGNGAALAPSGVSDETTALTPWNRLYGSLYTVNLGLKQLANGEVVSGGATPTEAAKALGDFLWAANLGTVATLYDKAYIPRDSNTFNLALKPYTEVRDSALARFDAMIAVASGKSWVIDPKYTFDLASGSLTGDVLARMARSLAARTLAQSARNASQNTATDWARVLAYAQSGISSIGGSGMDISASATTSNPLGNDYQAYVNSSSWTRVDGRVIHAMDPTQPLFWTSTTAPAQATSPDARLGTDFGFSGVQPFDPARGTYFLGSWFYKRTAYLSLDGGGGFVGLASQMRVAENDLLVAEAMIRSGGSLTSAASLVNKTRVGRGGLPAVLVSGVPISANCLPKAADGTSCGTLLDAVMYERLIELYGSNVAVGWGDARRTDVVPAGTPRSLPVPASIMTGKGLTPYTFGGAGLDGSTPAP